MKSIALTGRHSGVLQQRRFTARKVLVALFIVLIIFCTLAFIGLRWFEFNVTFHPQRFAVEQNWTLPKNGEEVWFTNKDNLKLHGWFIASASQPASGTVIYFHGNGGNISNVRWVGETLAGKSFNVLLFDYRGYGRSEGNISNEDDLYADADAAYDYVQSVKGESPERLILYGQSLGTAAAIDLASRRKCGALIVESGLSSAKDMAKALLPNLPQFIYSLARTRLENDKKVVRIYCPALFTHGDPDETIATEQGK